MTSMNEVINELKNIRNELSTYNPNSESLSKIDEIIGTLEFIDGDSLEDE